MMGIKYEVAAVTGTYTGRDGQEKKRYAKLGVVFETKYGLMLKLEVVPVGWDGTAYINEPKERVERPEKKADRGGIEDLADEIPF